MFIHHISICFQVFHPFGNIPVRLVLTLSAHAQEGCGSWVGLSVCVSVKSHLTSGVSVRPKNTRTQWAMEVKQLVEVSLKLLRCRDPALPPLKAIRMVSHFHADSSHAHYRFSIFHVVAPRILHFRVHS